MIGLNVQPFEELFPHYFFLSILTRPSITMSFSADSQVFKSFSSELLSISITLQLSMLQPGSQSQLLLLKHQFRDIYLIFKCQIQM